MKKTIKIIDLLNKIANGEEVPKKIKLDSYEFQYNKTYQQYHNKYETNLLEHISEYNYSGLNDEVEILYEEDEFEDIEELNKAFTLEDVTDELTTSSWEKSIMSKKINQLIKNQKKIIERLKNNDR